MSLEIELGERQLHEYTCGCCHAPVRRSWSQVLRDGGAYAVYFANCYHHRDQDHDAWLDVILGSWQAPYPDHVTFGCRVGPSGNGDPTPVSTLVEACQDGSAGPIHGTVLDRERGLAHPRVAEFWQVVDVVCEQDPTVRAHLYG